MSGLLAVAKDREKVREARRIAGPTFSPALSGAEVSQACEHAAQWALRTRRVKATDDERIALAQEVALAAIRSGASLAADDRTTNVRTYSSSGRATRRTYRERIASPQTRAYLRRTALGIMRDSRTWLDCAESHRTASERQRGADSMIVGADWTLEDAAQSGPLAVAATRAAIAASEHGAPIRDSEAHALADAVAARIAATMKPTDRRNVRVACALALGVNVADVATRERLNVGSLRVYSQRGRARIAEVAATASEWRELVADVAASADLRREADTAPTRADTAPMAVRPAYLAACAVEDAPTPAARTLAAIRCGEWALARMSEPSPERTAPRHVPPMARAAARAIGHVSESVGMGSTVYVQAARMTPRDREPQWGACHGRPASVLRYLAAWERRIGADTAASVTPRG